jgi:hypothetical protein
MRAR